MRTLLRLVRPRVVPRIAPLIAVVLLLAFTATSSRAANPDALWQIVHDRCVPDQQANGSPAPCALVDLTNGYAVLKDIVGATQFLLIATAKVTGIEDPAILAPLAPNYFAAAWQSHDRVEQLAGTMLPREALGLAINSAHGRTQNQLHIHIDCLRPDVAAAVRAHAASVSSTWAPFPVKLLGHPYLARRLASEDLSDANPFRLLADSVPGARDDMGQWTLVAVGATIKGTGFGAGEPGFVLLADHVDAATGDRASGEELQDHACAIKSPG